MKTRGSSRRNLAMVVALALVAWCAPMQKPAFADPVETTDALINALLAAVVTITGATVPGNVESNSQAISLLLPNSGAARLLDGTGEPLDPRNTPRGRFERDALEAALAGTLTQEERGHKLLTVVPLGVAAGCDTCHNNYVGLPPGEIVGAVSLRVPLQ